MPRIIGSPFLLFLLVHLCEAKDRPVIAIFTQPLPEEFLPEAPGSDYIAACYVKWLEGAGARAVPIQYNATDTEVEDVFNSVNGVLFPGGEAPYPRAARTMLRLALEANANGDHFPVWGTCLGFEWLFQLIAGTDAVVQPGFNSMNLSLPLDLTPAAQEATMLGAGTSFQQQLLSILSDTTDPVTVNAHRLGTPLDVFYGNEKLSSFFTVLSTNKDRDGKEFVSTVQAKGGVPVFAVQWHPERNQYEWGVNPEAKAQALHPCISHCSAAVKVMQFLAEFFVSEARKNTHTFTDSEKEWRALIWHHPVLSFQTGIFSQIYVILPHKKHLPTVFKRLFQEK